MPSGRVARQQQKCLAVACAILVSVVAVKLATEGGFEISNLFAGLYISERGPSPAAAGSASSVGVNSAATKVAATPLSGSQEPKAVFHSVTGLNTTFRDRRPLFVLKHLSKAGGTFSIWMAKKVLKQEFFMQLEDDRVLPPYMRGNHFVAMTMRNPCDWYVSWAHGAPKKVWGYKNPAFGPNPILPPKGYRVGPVTNEEMHDFVLNSRWPDGLGFISWYIWQLVLDPDCNHFRLRQLKNESFRKGETPERCLNSSKVRQDWLSLHPLQMAHCYVFQETSMSDLRACLQRYQQLVPAAKDAVDWELFEDLASNSSLLEEHFNKRFGTHEGKVLSTQWQRHKPCAELMQTGNLAQDIRESDPWLFEKFGYMDCCQRSSHSPT